MFQNAQNTISVNGLDSRTTSTLESFHSATNRSIPQHPNFYTFVDGLKHREFTKYTDFCNQFNGLYNQRPRKRKFYFDRDAKIEELSQELRAKRIRITDFLEETAKLSIKKKSQKWEHKQIMAWNCQNEDDWKHIRKLTRLIMVSIFITKPFIVIKMFTSCLHPIKTYGLFFIFFDFFLFSSTNL